MPVARLVLCEVRELRIRRRELTLVDQELGLWARQATLLGEQVELAVQARDAFQGVVEAAEQRAQDAEAERNAWYRHPALWFAVGVVVTGAVVAITAYALNAASP